MLSAPGTLVDATDVESPLAIEAAERLSMTEPSDEPTIATDSLVVIDAGEPAPLTAYPPAAEEAAPPSDRSRHLLREAHHLAGGAATADDYAAIIKRCRYVLAIDRSQEAIAYANQLAAWSLSKRGELHDEAGRDGEAEADFLDAIAADPECWRAEHRLGVQAARRGEFSEARRRFDRSLQIHPEHAKALGNRAAIELAEGDLPAALADYRQALEIDPDLASAHLGCGRVCHMTERYAEGLRHLDAAEVLAPGDAAVATARGDLLSDLGRYAQARDAYGRAIVLDPQASTAYRNLAWLLATCPQPEHRDGVAALANAERAEQLLGGADDLTLDTRAAALAAAGRFDEAVAAQRGAIDLAPPIDAAAYRERLSLYERGEAFSSRPSGVRQASYNADVAR
ncbi:MAG: tetratricopeptide repeat protein [Planctomycetota bacterium]